jgi:hypothetical protein
VSSTGTLVTTPDLSINITSMKSKGQPLPVGSYAISEKRFNHDFSYVRPHTDNSAIKSARGLNVRAFALGSDIIFGAGQYTPGNTER